MSRPVGIFTRGLDPMPFTVACPKRRAVRFRRPAGQRVRCKSCHEPFFARPVDEREHPAPDEESEIQGQVVRHVDRARRRAPGPGRGRGHRAVLLLGTKRPSETSGKEATSGVEAGVPGSACDAEGRYRSNSRSRCRSSTSRPRPQQDHQDRRPAAGPPASWRTGRRRPGEGRSEELLDRTADQCPRIGGATVTGKTSIAHQGNLAAN